VINEKGDSKCYQPNVMSIMKINQLDNQIKDLNKKLEQCGAANKPLKVAIGAVVTSAAVAYSI